MSKQIDEPQDKEAMEKRKLHLGNMTTREVAEWFGISYSTFRKTSDARYKELREYCKYKKLYGQIEVQEIFIEEYQKQETNKKFIAQVLKDEYSDSDDTSMNIATAIYNKYHDELQSITPLTCLTYVSKFRSKPKAKKSIRWSHKMEHDYGIYGIYLNDELIYIGMTARSFEQRWSEHKRILYALQEKPQGMSLYNYILARSGVIKFKVLVSVKDMNVARPPTQEELNMMELALITLYKPKCNILGITKQYPMTTIEDTIESSQE